MVKLLNDDGFVVNCDAWPNNCDGIPLKISGSYRSLMVWKNDRFVYVWYIRKLLLQCV